MSPFLMLAGMIAIPVGIIGFVVVLIRSKKVNLKWLGVVAGGIIAFNVSAKLLPREIAATEKYNQELEAKTEELKATTARNQVAISQVEVRPEVHADMTTDGKRKVVVWVRNGSGYTLNGKLNFESIDVDDRVLGWDLIYLENIEAGKGTFAIVWMKTAFSPRFRYEIQDFSFK